MKELNQLTELEGNWSTWSKKAGVAVLV